MYIYRDTEVQFKFHQPKPPESVCSLPCEKGQAKKYVEGESCCWHCFNCTTYQVNTFQMKIHLLFKTISILLFTLNDFSLSLSDDVGHKSKEKDLQSMLNKQSSAFLFALNHFHCTENVKTVGYRNQIYDRKQMQFFHHVLRCSVEWYKYSYLRKINF